MFQKLGIGDRSITCIKEFNSHDLSNLLWAYATLNTTHPALFQTVEDHIVQLDWLSAFKPQDLASIIWSYATHNAQHLQLFLKLKVGDPVVKSDDLAKYKPQAIDNILWAFA